jgi:hypothetical protein
VSAIAATSTSSYAQTHAGLTPSSGAALDHGFQTGLYVLTGLLLVGAVIAMALIKPSRPSGEDAVPVDGEVALEEAA